MRIRFFDLKQSGFRSFASMFSKLLAIALIAAMCAGAFEVQPSYPLEDLQYRLRRFNEWFWTLSEANKVVAVKSSLWGNGVFLTEPASSIDEPRKKVIKTGGLVMEVPQKYSFCDDSLRGRRYGKLLLDSGISEEDRIALTLLTEFLMGRNSEVFPWMNIVPNITELQPPHLWKYETQSLIEPFKLRDDARDRIRRMTGDYENLRKNPNRVLQGLEEHVQQHGDVELHQHLTLKDAENGETTPAGGLGLFTPARVFWAKALIDTRAWNMRGHKWLVPGADMFNHKPDHEDDTFDYKEVKFAGQRSDKFLRFHKIEQVRRGKGNGVMSALVYSDRDVFNRPSKKEAGAAEGSLEMQVFESYGDNTNDIYFSYHGFVPFEENKNDCQTISLELPRGKTNLLSSAQLAALSKVPTLTRQICVHDGEVPPALLLIGLVSQLSTSQLQHKCVTTVLQRPQGADTLYHAQLNKYHGLQGCLQGLLSTKVTKDHPSAAKSELDDLVHNAKIKKVVNGLKVSRLIVKGQFKAQFSSSDVAADEVRVAGLQASSPYTADVDHRVTALRLRISRKKILKRLLSDLKSKMEVEKAKMKGPEASDAKTSDEL